MMKHCRNLQKLILVLLVSFIVRIECDDSYTDDYISAVENEDNVNEKKVTGYFLPPETGEYKFFSKCTGECDVFLGGEKDSPKEKIIAMDGNESQLGEKASHLIYLKKGKSYFLQAATRGSPFNNESRASVGVVLPDDKKVFPISPKYLNRVVVEEYGTRKSANTTNASESRKEMNKSNNSRIRGNLLPIISRSKLKQKANTNLLKKLQQVGNFITSMENTKHREQALDSKVNELLKSLEVNVKSYKPSEENKNSKILSNSRKLRVENKTDIPGIDRSIIEDEGYPDSSATKETLVINLIDALKSVVGEDKERKRRDKYYQEQFKTLFKEINDLKRELKNQNHIEFKTNETDSESVNKFRTRGEKRHKQAFRQNNFMRKQTDMDESENFDEDVDDLFADEEIERFNDQARKQDEEMKKIHENQDQMELGNAYRNKNESEQYRKHELEEHSDKIVEDYDGNYVYENRFRHRKKQHTHQQGPKFTVNENNVSNNDTEGRSHGNTSEQSESKENQIKLNVGRQFDPISGLLKENSTHNDSFTEYNTDKDVNADPDSPIRVATDEAFVRLTGHKNEENKIDSIQTSKLDKHMDANESTVVRFRADDIKALENSLFHAFEARIKSGEFPKTGSTELKSSSGTKKDINIELGKQNKFSKTGDVRSNQNITLKLITPEHVNTPPTTDDIAKGLERDMQAAIASNVGSDGVQTMYKYKNQNLLANVDKVSSERPLVSEAVQAPLIRVNQAGGLPESELVNPAQLSSNVMNPSSRTSYTYDNSIIPKNDLNEFKQTSTVAIRQPTYSINKIMKIPVAQQGRIGTIGNQLASQNNMPIDNSVLEPALFARKEMMFYHGTNNRARATLPTEELQSGKGMDSVNNEFQDNITAKFTQNDDAASHKYLTKPSPIQSINNAAELSYGSSNPFAFENHAFQNQKSLVEEFSSKDYVADQNSQVTSNVQAARITPTDAESPMNVEISDEKFKNIRHNPTPVEKYQQVQNGIKRQTSFHSNPTKIIRPLYGQKQSNKNFHNIISDMDKVAIQDIASQQAYLTKIRGLLSEINNLKDRILSMKRDQVAAVNEDSTSNLHEELVEKENLLEKLKALHKKNRVIVPKSRKIS